MSSPKFKCTNPNCNARNSRNQLKGSNGHCLQCKVAMTHQSWLGGTPTISQTLCIPKEMDNQLKELAKEAEVTIAELIRVAVSLRLDHWTKDRNDTEKLIKQDLVYEKLSRKI